jgi:8-amino-7-oxononanoate synthase
VDADAELRELAGAGLLRKLRTVAAGRGPHVTIGEKELLNFSSNDYLGLASSAELKDAMIEGVHRFGVGSGASRLVCGNSPAHEALEAALAAFKGTEAALAFSSGYASAMGTIPALCGSGDVIILDKLSHASLIDAARLSGATIRIFPHNHLGKLERLLVTSREKLGAQAKVLVVTESIFSMDGDAAELRGIAELAERHHAMLLVDEAHAVGVLGPQGKGLIAELGLEKRVTLQMGTLSKALGVSGGYIAASRSMADLLINKARSLIYSTAPPPAIAFTAMKAVEIVASPAGDELRCRLQENIKAASASWIGSPLPMVADEIGRGPPLHSAILPLIIGDETAAMKASAELLERGFLIPAIRYPTVARGTARLRLTLSAAHEPGQIEGLVTHLLDLVPQLGSATAPAIDDAGEEPLAQDQAQSR